MIDLSRWKLVFSDDFNGSKLDRTKWRFRSDNRKECEIRRGGYWSKDQIILKDSHLILRTEYKDGPSGPGWYASAVTTDGLFNHRYGYYEARCILPKGTGFWASFWIQSNNMRIPGKDTGGGLNGAELDIFEAPYYGRGPEQRSRISTAVHVDGFPPLLHSRHLGDFLATDPYNHFNTYGVEWNKNEYIFYINRNETCRTHFRKGTSRVPEYMILSVEVCGENAVPGRDWAGLITDGPGTQPANFIVDYVRVYDKISE